MFWEDQREWGGDQGSVWEHVRQVSGKPGKRLDFLDFLYLPFWENVRLCLPCGCFSCFDSLKITIMLLLKIQQQLTLVVVEFFSFVCIVVHKVKLTFNKFVLQDPKGKASYFCGDLVILYFLCCRTPRSRLATYLDHYPSSNRCLCQHMEFMKLVNL